MPQFLEAHHHEELDPGAAGDTWPWQVLGSSENDRDTRGHSPWEGLLVSSDDQKKAPQTRWLQTVGIDSLTYLEAGSLKSRCRQGDFFLGAKGESVP